jgi:two-component system response regulator YesN
MKNRVLVCVDDDASILQMLQYQLELVLEGTNCISEFYDEPKEALHAIESMINDGMDIAAVIVDYQMPQINGNTFVRTLKAKYPDMRFIMLSGQANEVHVEELLAENLLQAFISKPWTADELGETLKTYIR